MTDDPGTFESATAGRPDFDAPSVRYDVHALRAGGEVPEHVYLQRALYPSRADVPIATVPPVVARWLIACAALAGLAEELGDVTRAPRWPAEWRSILAEYRAATAALDEALPPRATR